MALWLLSVMCWLLWLDNLLKIIQQAMQGSPDTLIHLCLYVICSSIGIWLTELTPLPSYVRGVALWFCGIYAENLATEWGIL